MVEVLRVVFHRNHLFPTSKVVKMDVCIRCYFYPRMLEMVSQGFKISKYHGGGACPQTPLAWDRLRDHFNQYFW